MPKAKAVLRQGHKALKDLNLLKVLQSEIQHELSFKPPQEGPSKSLGEFSVDWDSPKSQDVVLRRKFESGEEVAVSALLGPFRSHDSEIEEGLYLRDVLMKVCVKKPGLSSMLQFDCLVHEVDRFGFSYGIRNAYYLQSSAALAPSVYRGPSFNSLSGELQFGFREYLESKGIGVNLTNFILHHLHKKEQGQYVNWLQKLESCVAKSE